MKDKKLFSIGELSKICALSVSSLRHYDKLGVLKPVWVDSETGYRYYDDDSIVTATLLSVYKNYGLSLIMAKSLLERDDLSELRRTFVSLNHEMEQQITEIRMSQKFFSEWVELIDEAKRISDGDDPGIGIRFVEYRNMYCGTPKIFPYTKLKHLLVDCEGICDRPQLNTLGPLFLHFPTVEQRRKEDLQGVKSYIALHPGDSNYGNTVTLGGYSAITAFHKGSFGTVGKTYDKMCAWAKAHNIELRGDCLERYVTDYWSSCNKDLFVTELILPLK